MTRRMFLYGAAALEEMVQGLGGRGCVVKDGWAIKAWGDQREIGGYARPEPPEQAANHSRRFAFLGLAPRPLVPLRAQGAPSRGSETILSRARQHAEEPNHAVRDLEDGLRFRAGNRRISASVRDFARIAWFWLNKGNWNGVQLLPERYFSRYVKPSVRPSADACVGVGYIRPALYGFTWWFNEPDVRNTGLLPWPDAPRDTFASLGVRGNYSFVFPGMNALLVSASGNWGKFGPGDPVANRTLRLFMQAARRKAS